MDTLKRLFFQITDDEKLMEMKRAQRRSEKRKATHPFYRKQLKALERWQQQLVVQVK